jgi:hypothetical protein
VGQRAKAGPHISLNHDSEWLVVARVLTCSPHRAQCSRTPVQAEKHVGRRHAKGRKGGALKGDKTNGGDGQSRDARAETSASSDDYLGGRQMDLYATPAPLSKNADGGVHIEGLERRLAGSELAATPGEGRQAMSARATAAKGERGGAPAGNGDGEGGVCADEPKGTAGAHDWHERSINDAALAAALAGYNPGGLRKRREVHRDEIARAGSALGSSRVHSPEEDGASDSKRPRPAGGLGGQATCVDVASAGAAELDGKRVVVTFTGFKGADSIALHTKILHLGGTYAPHFHVGVTHVVCACDAQRRTQRTFKYSMGLVSGSVLVTPAWVHACRSQGSWREPWQDEHFVTGSVVHGEEHPGPNQRVSCPEPIFSGKCFYLAGTFVPPNPSREEVTLLLKAGGATVVQQQPNLRTIIALCGDDLEETTYQHLRTMQATMVTPAFVMDSISLYGLQDVGDYRYEP